MRVRSTYVATCALLAAALGAPFALPRLLDRHGSAGVATQAIAPPAAPAIVVQMAAQPRPKAVVRARHVLVRATPHIAVAHAELASVRARPVRVAHAELASVRARPVRVAPAVARRVQRRRPLPEESRRAPEPAPAAAPTVVAVTPQPVNLNATDAAAAQAPAPVQTPPPPAPVPLEPVPATDPGQVSDDQGHDQGHSNGKGNGEGNGHGHGQDH
jgi:hypothetical protein